MSGRLLVSSTTLAAAALSTVTYFASHSRVAHTKTASPPPASTLRPIPCRDGTLVFPFSFPSREANLRRLEKEHFDVLVIGGGCVGAGVALDASLRGLKVAVVDADDFASGTSGRSTKLIHGGVRYLENAFWHLDLGEYRLVREALHERRHMLHAAPHMARALPIMVPLEAWWQVPYFWAGTKVYDFVAGKNSGVPPSMFMSREQALFAFPMLNPDRLKGAVVYYDGQMNDTRYALSVLLTAVQAGAAAGNYCRVQGLGTNAEGKITSAMCRDAISGREFEIKARAVVNATGPFSDSIRHMAENASRKAKGLPPHPEESQPQDLIVPAGGVHVVLPDHFSPQQMGLIVPHTSDDRVLFFLPWEGGTLCGTTDSKTDLTMMPKPSLEEIDFVLAESSRYLNRPVHRRDVRAAWSGIRPLVKDLAKSKRGGTALLSREHVVELSAGGVVTIAGGKWTTYRKMAEDALDKVLDTHPKLKVKAGVCTTANSMLVGADRARIVCDQRFDIIQITLREEYGFDRDVAAHLTSSYGTRSLQIAEMIVGGYMGRAPGLHPKRLVAKHPVLEAEVVFAVEQEYALTAIDFLARRTRLAFLDHAAAVQALPAVVDMMAKLLNWSAERKQAEVTKATQFLDTMRVPDDEEEDAK